MEHIFVSGVRSRATTWFRWRSWVLCFFIFLKKPDAVR
jgi:hypothetical protein